MISDHVISMPDVGISLKPPGIHTIALPPSTSFRQALLDLLLSGVYLHPTDPGPGGTSDTRPPVQG